jgi:hypothetical protein
VWIQRKNCFGGNSKFFRLILRHDNLKNYFETNFALMQHHKYSLNDLDNMMPWEKSLYIDMLIEHIKEENEKIKLQQQQR